MNPKIKFDENAPDFAKLARTEQNPKTRIRLLALAQLKKGVKIKDVAKAIGFDRHNVGEWYRWYQAEGIAGLKDAPRSGRIPNLSRDQENNFKEQVALLQKTRTGGRITGADIQRMAVEKFGAHYTEFTIYKLLERLNISWITARSIHPKSDPAAQAAFKKTSQKQLGKRYPKKST